MAELSTAQANNISLHFNILKNVYIFCLEPVQIIDQDPEIRVPEIWREERIVPRPVSQLHPLRPLPGRGLHDTRVPEAGSVPELAGDCFPSRTNVSYTRFTHTRTQSFILRFYFIITGCLI